MEKKTALITGARALITGASSGIGRELAKIHASQGGDLVIVARSEDKLQALKAEIEKQYKVKVTIIVKDLSRVESCQEIYAELKKANLEIDYLINNAGFGGVGKFHELDLQTQINMINLNMTSLTVLSHLFLNDFVKRNSGKILNVSSTASFMPGPLQAVYYATKSYVQFLSNAISEELSETNITVTNLMPGATETGFGAISGMDKTSLFNKTASAYTVALDGYNGMIEGKLDVISGVPASLMMQLKLVPFVPKKFLLKQVKKMQEV